jgi:hypothetical protein
MMRTLSCRQLPDVRVTSTDTSTVSVAMMTELAFLTAAFNRTPDQVADPSTATSPSRVACRSTAARFSTTTMRDLSWPFSNRH